MNLFLSISINYCVVVNVLCMFNQMYLKSVKPTEYDGNQGLYFFLNKLQPIIKRCKYILFPSVVVEINKLTHSFVRTLYRAFICI